MRCKEKPGLPGCRQLGHCKAVASSTPPSAALLRACRFPAAGTHVFDQDFRFRLLAAVNYTSKPPPLERVGSQNWTRSKVQRYVTVKCRGVPTRREVGQAMPSGSSRNRRGGTARHMPFEATFWAMRSAVQSKRRSLPSGHRPTRATRRVGRCRLPYAASRQE